MTFNEARDVFLNRGYVEVEGGQIFDGDKWRQCIVVISEWLKQEPCDKYITEIDHLRKYISKLETQIVEQEQRWIPVSERLPMPFEFVNCTCHSLIDDREDWVIETGYIPQPPDSPYSDWGNIPMLNSGDCEVVAWMHRNIPKPYKAESEELN